MIWTLLPLIPLQFYVENWMRWFDDKRVEKGIKRARFEMDELEELMRQAGLTREG